MYREVGEPQSALPLLGKLTTLKPDDGHSWFYLVSICPEDELEEYLSRMKAGLQEHHEDENLDFAIAIALDRLNRIDEAAVEFDRANRIKRVSLS